MPNTKLHRLASRESHERVAATCPAVHTGGTKAIASFHQWLQRRAWMTKLSEKEALALEVRIGDFTGELFEAAKEFGTRPLREALTTAIHENMLATISPARLAQIEAGQDANAEELLQASPASSFCQS